MLKYLGLVALIVALTIALITSNILLRNTERRAEQYPTIGHQLAVACYNEGFAEGKVRGMNILIENKIQEVQRSEGCK